MPLFQGWIKAQSSQASDYQGLLKPCMAQNCQRKLKTRALNESWPLKHPLVFQHMHHGADLLRGGLRSHIVCCQKSSNDVKSVHAILAFPVKYSMKQQDVSPCSRQEAAHNNKSSEICSFRGTSNQIPHSTDAGGWCQISQFVFNTSVFLHIAACQTLRAHKTVLHIHHLSGCGTPGVRF